jgi:hypothetical protein
MRLLPVLALLLVAPASAQGRPLRVTGIAPLAFGTLIPGVPVMVPPADAARAGQFEIRGQKAVPLQLTFVLPVAMIGPGGVVLPLAFGAADAGFSASGNGAAQAAFDPRVPATFTLPGNGKASVFLGGRALPVNGQAAGSYTGTITFVVSYLGS